MPDSFVPGNNYTNSLTPYGLRPYDEQDNTEAASIPDATYQCVAVTNTSAVFKRTQPKGTGPTANPGVLLGTTQRLRLERDATGLMAFPMGRAYGRPILRPSVADLCAVTFNGVTWPTTTAGPCWPASNGPSFVCTAPFLTLSGACTSWTGFLYGPGSSAGTFALPIGGGNTGTGRITFSASWNNTRSVASTMMFATDASYSAGLTNPTVLAAGDRITIKIDGYTYLDWVGPGTFNPNIYTPLPSIPVGATVPLRVTVDVVISPASVGAIWGGMYWTNAFTP